MSDERTSTRARTPVLSLREVSIEVRATAGSRCVVSRASLEVQPGAVTAIVGESGSGKTLLARSILGLLPPAARVSGGSIQFAGQDLLTLSESSLQSVRGARIGMVFQEPLTALNPALRIGVQMAEAVRLHLGLSESEARQRCIALLERVQIADAAACLQRYPHELSGGMRQRIMIAAVMLLRPALLIADEPTTALDPITQERVMQLMLELARESATAVLLISHDLSLVARYASEHVVVMRRGEIVEQGATADVLRQPAHEYTRELLAAACGARSPAGSEDRSHARPVLLRASGVQVAFPGRRHWVLGRRARKLAVCDVDLTVHRGETVALVGESGSGKSSFGRALLGLVPVTAGRIEFDGLDLSRRDQLRDVRRRVQFIFQDPYSSLDPRMRIHELIAEPLRTERQLTQKERESRVAQMLEEVGLTADYVSRYAHQLSGGQRQRVGIARALIGKPEFVIADEAVAALDVTIRAQVLELLCALKAKHGFAMLFISHDFAAVERVADTVAVMQQGRLIEVGEASRVFSQPAQVYTRELLAASLRLALNEAGEGFHIRDRTLRSA